MGLKTPLGAVAWVYSLILSVKSYLGILIDIKREVLLAPL